jgi:S1-C subfamily serine protease
VNLLDAVIIMLVLVAIIRGIVRGLLVQVCSWIGVALGLVVGALAAPHVAGLADGAPGKRVLTLLCVVGAAIVGGVAGAVVGERLAEGAKQLNLGGVDTWLGGAIGGVATLLGIWLIAGSIATVQSGNVGRWVQESAIIRRLDQMLPPVPSITARLGRLLDPLGFPSVFAGIERAPAAPVPAPTTAEVQAGVDLAAASTVRIEGKGCGGLLEGSGFVAAANLVVTNAHVIAGIRHPQVQDGAGTHDAAPVLFDAGLDLAVLRVEGLTGRPLVLATDDAPRGTTGAVLGYPENGPFRADPGAVLDEYRARGRDIYGSGLVTRTIYELQATVQPGNSGGPFVLPDGRVAGVVFARSVSQNTIGYALTAADVANRLQRVASEPVGTGACAAG